MGMHARPFLAALAALALSGAAAADERKVILVFTSDDSEAGKVIIEAFAEQVDFAIRMTYDLGGSSQSMYFVSDQIRGFDSSLIFAVGDRALQAAAREFIHVPVVYSGANENRVVLGRSDVVGVGLWPDPTTSVPRLRQAVPSLRRLGVIRLASDGGEYWQALQAACDLAGVRLVTGTVSDPSDVPSALRYLVANADLLWLHDLPSLWTPTLLADVLHTAWFHRLPVVGFSPEQLEGPQPAAMALVDNPRGVGVAAAEVARQILIDGIAAESLVLPRVESRLLGSRKALRHSRQVLTRRTEPAFDGWVGE